MHTTFFLVLPFVASMMYGLSYVLLEKVVGVHVNPASFMVVNTLVGLIFLCLLIFVKGENIDFSAVAGQGSVWLMILVAAATPSLGWLATIYAIKNTSALYTALAETSYPLFTLAFGFMLFGIKQLNMVTLCGGIVVLCGAVLMIYGQNTTEE